MKKAPVFSNVRVFYNIANEAYELMNEQLKSDRRPKPDGKPGWIITIDPEQKSFKNPLIALIFAGVCLEAALHLLIVKRKGVEVYKKYDRKMYEDKLQLLGCNDQEIMNLCEQYRSARREVVHEKAHLDQGKILKAQDEAASAIDLLKKVFAYFQVSL